MLCQKTLIINIEERTKNELFKYITEGTTKKKIVAPKDFQIKGE